ncbi:hypothetical protein PAPYR_9383 [Paratrimastix pyriformis]|uniref:Uncharacterized protein n=1 Tax=Paratrimastix pyriformis TaxID=342808 RepID=A0ABQ8UC70_9EUKA|nr:hypothetical protein PAPYR_9383 [Paratrimastix pyriformis]
MTIPAQSGTAFAGSLFSALSKQAQPCVPEALVRNALLVFFEPDPASPKSPDLPTPNEAARQAIAVGQLQVQVIGVRFDKALTRFQVYDPAKQITTAIPVARPFRSADVSSSRAASLERGLPPSSSSALVFVAAGTLRTPLSPSVPACGRLTPFCGHPARALRLGEEATSTEGGDTAPRKVMRRRFKRAYHKTRNLGPGY